MYVASVPNRKSPPAILLRESYRQGSKVKTRTLANLSHWPPAQIEALRALLRGAISVGVLEDAFEVSRSLDHGHVAAVRLVERMAVDAEKAYLWVDGEGELLRMKTTNGLLMERSTRSAILRRFPQKAGKIQALGFDGTR